MLLLGDRSESRDLKKKKMNRRMLNIPMVSSSKNPSEVRLIYDELSAKKSA
jgi:hypothetical protein